MTDDLFLGKLCQLESRLMRERIQNTEMIRSFASDIGIHIYEHGLIKEGLDSILRMKIPLIAQYKGRNEVIEDALNEIQAIKEECKKK